MNIGMSLVDAVRELIVTFQDDVLWSDAQIFNITTLVIDNITQTESQAFNVSKVMQENNSFLDSGSLNTIAGQDYNDSGTYFLATGISSYSYGSTSTTRTW
jgi:hypothetical protein